MEQSAKIALLKRYLEGNASPEEVVIVDRWYEELPDAHLSALEKEQTGNFLYRQISMKLSLAEPIDTAPLHETQDFGRSTPTPVAQRVHFLRTAWFRYAAAVILLLGSVAYFWATNNKSNQPLTTDNKSSPADIEPGSNKAILTLADGSTIVLDKAADGELAQQGNAQVIKLSNGQIAYNVRGTAEGEVMMNTMSTPRGGQYQLTLPDGSKVWLNAASSITYPAVFVGKERKVKITGETYLEVAKDKTKPFIVDVDGKSFVEVVGTSFNINSYANEHAIKTTLVEGSVKVRVGNKESLLKPGQAAEVTQASNTIKVLDNADIDQTLAWKNGIFNLQNLSLQEFARQLERWYDIEVRYEGNVLDKTFEGKFGRDVRLSTVLNWFSELGIPNRLENRTLILGTTNH